MPQPNSTPARREPERRFLQGLELRELEKPEDGRIATLDGYAAVFDSWSEELGYFREIIRKGCFRECLEGGEDVRALVGHESTMIIGRRSAKTLDIAEDDKGLKVSISVPDTSAGRDLVVSVRRKDLDGMSFGFFTIEDKWSERTVDGKTTYERELIRAEVFEVSVVTWPAYIQTSVEARALALLGGETRAKELLEEAKKRTRDPAAIARRDRRIELHRQRMAMWT